MSMSQLLIFSNSIAQLGGGKCDNINLNPYHAYIFLSAKNYKSSSTTGILTLQSLDDGPVHAAAH